MNPGFSVTGDDTQTGYVTLQIVTKLTIPEGQGIGPVARFSGKIRFRLLLAR